MSIVTPMYYARAICIATAPRDFDKVSRQWHLGNFEGSANNCEYEIDMRFTPCLVYRASLSARVHISLLIAADQRKSLAACKVSA